MEMAQYLDRLLLRYSGTFDIYKPYFIDGKEYPAYGYFFSHLEKYLLVREANLWASDSYEHILFITADKITEEHVKEAQDVIQNYMEPKLVRKGARVPEKDHMYSFLTVILLSQYPPDRNTLKSVKRYSFDKGYRFNLRGFSTGHMALVSMEDRKITCNRAAAKKVTPSPQVKLAATISANAAIASSSTSHAKTVKSTLQRWPMFSSITSPRDFP